MTPISSNSAVYKIQRALRNFHRTAVKFSSIQRLLAAGLFPPQPTILFFRQILGGRIDFNSTPSEYFLARRKKDAPPTQLPEIGDPAAYFNWTFFAEDRFEEKKARNIAEFIRAHRELWRATIKNAQQNGVSKSLHAGIQWLEREILEREDFPQSAVTSDFCRSLHTSLLEVYSRLPIFGLIPTNLYSHYNLCSPTAKPLAYLVTPKSLSEPESDTPSWPNQPPLLSGLWLLRSSLETFSDLYQDHVHIAGDAIIQESAIGHISRLFELYLYQVFHDQKFDCKGLRQIAESLRDENIQSFLYFPVYQYAYSEPDSLSLAGRFQGWLVCICPENVNLAWPRENVEEFASAVREIQDFIHTELSIKLIEAETDDILEEVYISEKKTPLPENLTRDYFPRISGWEQITIERTSRTVAPPAGQPGFLLEVPGPDGKRFNVGKPGNLLLIPESRALRERFYADERAALLRLWERATAVYSKVLAGIEMYKLRKGETAAERQTRKYIAERLRRVEHATKEDAAQELATILWPTGAEPHVPFVENALVPFTRDGQAAPLTSASAFLIFAYCAHHQQLAVILEHESFVSPTVIGPKGHRMHDAKETFIHLLIRTCAALCDMCAPGQEMRVRLTDTALVLEGALTAEKARELLEIREKLNTAIGQFASHARHTFEPSHEDGAHRHDFSSSLAALDALRLVSLAEVDEGNFFRSAYDLHFEIRELSVCFRMEFRREIRMTSMSKLLARPVV